MTEFIESPRFPDDIAYGSAGGPGFKTFVFEAHSGAETRVRAWSIARGRWDVSYGIRDKDDMDIVRAFFYEMRGRATGFRYKDWGDYELTAEPIGTGDGVQTVFPIIKTYGATSPYIRRIYKPIASGFAVTVNGTPVTIGAGPTEVALDTTTGTLTFGASAVPPNTHVVAVTGEFDVPVRFDIDQMSAQHEGWMSENWESIPLVELRVEDFT